MMVRGATDRDIGSIIEGIKAFVAASSYGDWDTVNEAHVELTLHQLISSDDGCVAVLEDDDGAFAGCFVGLAHAHLFSAARMLGELFIYTVPRARGHGSKLRRFAEDWAREGGCKTFCVSHPESEAHLEKVYGRWGFKPHERAYRKELE